MMMGKSRLKIETFISRNLKEDRLCTWCINVELSCMTVLQQGTRTGRYRSVHDRPKPAKGAQAHVPDDGSTLRSRAATQRGRLASSSRGFNSPNNGSRQQDIAHGSTADVVTAEALLNASSTSSPPPFDKVLAAGPSNVVDGGGADTAQLVFIVQLAGFFIISSYAILGIIFFIVMQYSVSGRREERDSPMASGRRWDRCWDEDDRNLSQGSVVQRMVAISPQGRCSGLARHRSVPHIANSPPQNSIPVPPLSPHSHHMPGEIPYNIQSSHSSTALERLGLDPGFSFTTSAPSDSYSAV
ncbi:hypothetical protein CYMTET_53736 [Cymbomonas tetramitiformis]|uniref:Uncharacterized protein n=1 Tax=Cymbomonas tetramitiformis TaxID=36881 RepID=A0AAE0BHK4_9CHLO|nr:hypothetical protein CYMTET_53736 [Cymbomonas tetramitiformis]